MKLSAHKIRTNLKKGFTLIELLVVIGILGILAAALVATIDPFEQLNKARDAKTENTLAEYQNGLLRYYSIKGTMPWSDSVDMCIGGAVETAIDPAVNLGADIPDCVTALVTQGELKPAFTTATDSLSSIIIAADASNDVTMCYLPVSKAKQRDGNAKFNAIGAETTGCKSQASGGGGTSCYWCTR